MSHRFFFFFCAFFTPYIFSILRAPNWLRDYITAIFLQVLRQKQASFNMVSSQINFRNQICICISCTHVSIDLSNYRCLFRIMILVLWSYQLHELMIKDSLYMGQTTLFISSLSDLSRVLIGLAICFFLMASTFGITCSYNKILVCFYCIFLILHLL